MLQREASLRIHTMYTSIQSGQSENTTGGNEQQMWLKSPADVGMDPLLLGRKFTSCSSLHWAWKYITLTLSNNEEYQVSYTSV